MIEYYICKIAKKLTLRALKNSSVHPSSSVGPGSEFMNSTLGRHSYVGYYCRILNTEIGSFCSIANECVIGADSHSLNWVSTSPVFNRNKDQISYKYSYHKFETRSSVIIGHDVWIGERVIIKSGLVIGDGSVIGAGSVVTKSIPPYEIWGGVPAKFIKNRFDKVLSERLLASKWWSFDDQRLRELATSIKEPEEFLKKI